MYITFTVAKKADCDGIMVMSTSDYSRKIFKRLEIDVIAKKDWEDCVYDGIRPLGMVESQYVTGHFKKI